MAAGSRSELYRSSDLGLWDQLLIVILMEKPKRSTLYGINAKRRKRNILLILSSSITAVI